jgi:hypothetical protein
MGDYDYSVRRKVTDRPYGAYACKTVTVSGVSDYSLKTHSTLFNTLQNPAELVIRNGSQDITVKFNSSANDPIPVYADTDFGTSSLIVNDLFLTVSGSSTITIFTLGWS